MALQPVVVIMGLPARASATSHASEGFRALIDKVPVGLVWLDAAGNALRWNDQAESLLASLAGKRLDDTIQRMLQACRSTGTCIQTQYELSKTERVHVSVAADEHPDEFLVVLDRKKLEKARAEATVLRTVLKAVGGSTSRHDAVRRALEAVRSSLPFAHLAFFELDGFGLSLSCTAWSGMNENDALIEPLSTDPADNLIAVALKHQRPVHIAQLTNAPGRLPFAPTAGLGAVLMPLGGRVPRGVLYVAALPDVLNEGAFRLVQALCDAIGALLDIASLEAEAAKARDVASQRDRLATIGQLVAGVAHEINNPLAFLKSNLHSLKQEVDDLREQRPDSQLGEFDDIVAESLDGVARIELLVQALKGTSRNRNEKIRFDPARAVNEAVTIFRGAKRSECEISCELGQLPEMLGSPSALGQVVLNLMQNGLDAMGSVERARRKLEIAAKCEGEVMYLTVRDHGTGIPLEVQQRMYDAFFTTKGVGKGTGLGLYICKEIIEGFGGHMELTTGPTGTTFHLMIPLAEE